MNLEDDVFRATEGSNHKTANKQLQSWDIAKSSAPRQGFVRGLIAALGLLPHQKAGYGLYSICHGYTNP